MNLFWRLFSSGLGFSLDASYHYPVESLQDRTLRVTHPPTSWIISIVSTPDKIHNGKVVTDLSLLTPPLNCSLIVYGSTVSSEYLQKQMKLPYWKRKVEYFDKYGGEDTCFLVFQPGAVSSDGTSVVNGTITDLPKYDSLREELITSAATDRAKYRARYDAGLSLIDAVEHGNILPSPRGVPHWLIYMDFDTIVTDKTFTFARVLNQVEDALKRPTTEERSCAEHSLSTCQKALLRGDPEKGYSQELSPTSVNQFHTLMTTDQDPHADFLINLGVMMVQASKGGAFILESMLSLYNGTETGQDYTDQGVMYNLLNLFFDWDANTMREIYTGDSSAQIWTAGVNPPEIRMIRHLNIDALRDNHLDDFSATQWIMKGYKEYQEWQESTYNDENARDSDPVKIEPLYVAILPAKIMNACARYLGDVLGHARVNHWDCDSPIAHFMGCTVDECYTQSHWRRIFRSCNTTNIPFETNDDGTTPFDFDKFIREAKS